MATEYLFRAVLVALALAAALPAAADSYLYFVYRGGNSHEPLELARFDFSEERLEGPRAIPEIKEPEATVHWRGPNALIHTKTRAVLHHWESGTTRILFDATATHDGSYGESDVFVYRSAIGAGLALVGKGTSARSYTAVYDTRSGDLVDTIDRAGIFDGAGERFVVWDDGVRIMERAPDGGIVETGTLSPSLSALPQFIDLERGYAVEWTGRYVPTDGSPAEFSFGLQGQPGHGNNAWVASDDGFYVFRPATRQVEAYDRTPAFLGATVIDTTDLPTTGGANSLAWVDNRLFVAALKRDGTDHRDPIELTYAEVDLGAFGAPRYTLREVFGLDGVTASPSPEIAHVGESSVVLLESHIGIYDWQKRAFAALLERPPPVFDQMAAMPGGDGFLLWSQWGSAVLYRLDVEARTVSGWGGGPVLDHAGIHSIQPLPDDRALVFLRRNPSVFGSTGEVLLVHGSEGIIDRAPLTVRSFLGRAGDLAGDLPEGTWVATENAEHRRIRVGTDGLLQIEEVDSGPGLTGFTTQLVVARSPDGRHDLVTARASGTAHLNGRLAVVDRTTGAYAMIEGRWAAEAAEYHPAILWAEDGATLFYGGALARFRYDGMQASLDGLPDYAFIDSWSAFPVGTPIDLESGLHWWMWDFPSGGLFPASHHDVEGLISPFDNVGGGRWREGNRAVSRSFGSYNTKHAPWYYFEHYGYGYSPPERPEWVYFPNAGWMWTREGVFPRLYSADFEGWLRYRRSEGPLAWFDHITKGYWLDTAPGWAPLNLARLVLRFDFEGAEEIWTFSNNIAVTVRFFDDEDGEWVSIPFRLEVERFEPDTLRLHMDYANFGIYMEGEYTLTFHTAFEGEAYGEVQVFGPNRVLLHVESGHGSFTVER